MATDTAPTAPVIPELPQSGGAYRVNPDGSLTVVQQPQTPATAAATYPISEE